MKAKTLRIDGLKSFAARELSVAPVVRDVIMLQPDEMSHIQFMQGARAWLQFLRAELAREQSR